MYGWKELRRKEILSVGMSSSSSDKLQKQVHNIDKTKEESVIRTIVPISDIYETGANLPLAAIKSCQRPRLAW